MTEPDLDVWSRNNPEPGSGLFGTPENPWPAPPEDPAEMEAFQEDISAQVVAVQELAVRDSLRTGTVT